MALCEHRDIWSLTYINGLDMFCSVCRMNNAAQQRARCMILDGDCSRTLCTTSYNFLTMYDNSVTTEKMKAGSYFIQKERETKERMRFMKNNSRHIFVGKRKNFSDQISIFVGSSLLDYFETRYCDPNKKKQECIAP